MKTKTKKEIKEFVLKTLLPYKENPELCALENDSCRYLTSDGKKCAVGKWMKEGEWQSFNSIILSLTSHYKLHEFLNEEAINMNISLESWTHIQDYHDSIASKVSNKSVNFKVKCIEGILDIKLPELLIN